MKSFIEEIKNDPRFIDRSSFDMQDELHQKFWIVKENVLNIVMWIAWISVLLLQMEETTACAISQKVEFRTQV